MKYLQKINEEIKWEIQNRNPELDEFMF